MLLEEFQEQHGVVVVNQSLVSKIHLSRLHSLSRLWGEGMMSLYPLKCGCLSPECAREAKGFPGTQLRGREAKDHHGSVLLSHSRSGKVGSGGGSTWAWQGQDFPSGLF